MGIWIGSQESKGPYGYLCLGLVYFWKNDEKVLELQKLVLIKVDIKLRNAIEMPLYYNHFEVGIDQIIEKDGKHYYKKCRILNYEMIKIPTKLSDVNDVDDVDDFWSHREEKNFLNKDGLLKHSINRACRVSRDFFDKEYVELYACALDFDKEKLTGLVVGFDCLGKINWNYISLKGITDLEYIRKSFLMDKVLCNRKINEDREAREREYGVLNLECFIDKNGMIDYNYEPVWD